MSLVTGTEQQRSKTWGGGDSRVSLLNTYIQQNEDTELRSQAKERWMAARFRVFGTDNSGKHLCPKERMPKQIRDGDCSAVLCKELITCLKFLKGWNISWTVQIMILVLSPMKSINKVMGKFEYSWLKLQGKKYGPYQWSLRITSLHYLQLQQTLKSYPMSLLSLFSYATVRFF